MPYPCNPLHVDDTVPMWNVVCYTHFRGIPYPCIPSVKNSLSVECADAWWIPYPCTPSSVPMGNSFPVRSVLLIGTPDPGNPLLVHPFREEFLARSVRGSAVNTYPCVHHFICANVKSLPVVWLRHTDDPLPSPQFNSAKQESIYLRRNMSGVGGHMLPCQYSTES